MSKKLPNNNQTDGFSLISVSLTLGIVLAFGLTLMSYALHTNRTSKFYGGTLSAIQLAEAGVAKSLFCLNAPNGDKCGGTYGSAYAGETDISLGDGSFTSSLNGAGSTLTLIVEGMSAIGKTRKIKVEVTTIPTDDEMDWGYALQSGAGGAYMANGAVVTGTIYSNGDIECQSNLAEIDGDAYVAKVGGFVDGCTVGYHAHADQVLNADVGGDAYYANDPADISGTTVTGTKYSGSTTPEVKDLPSLNLDYWRTAAEAGGTFNGDY